MGSRATNESLESGMIDGERLAYGTYTSQVSSIHAVSTFLSVDAEFLVKRLSKFATCLIRQFYTIISVT